MVRIEDLNMLTDSEKCEFRERLPLASGTVRSNDSGSFWSWTRILYMAISALALMALYHGSNTSISYHTCTDDSFAVTSSGKVSLEASIMSKCPDARDCIRDLIVPTMANISDKVDFTLSFIGTIDDDNDGVQCKHGPSECIGNTVELCAAELYPDPKIFLGFTMCLGDNYENIPVQGFVKDCALEHGIDFEKLNDCLSEEDGQHAADLLRDSVRRNIDNGIKFSCTVQLENQIRCIRDGGEWKDCDGGHEPSDLIRDIKDALSSE